MRFKHKKLFISGTAVAAAGALGVGALLQTVLSVQASSDMMPGIEQIVSENTEDEPFRILELVNNSEDAEIGYYISGQEPSLKLYQYQYTDSSDNLQTVHFSSVQEALSKLPAAQRLEFMQGSINGIKNIAAVAGDDGPLSYSQYTEKYFPDSGDTGWTKVDLTDFNGNTRTDTVSVNGSYQENSAGTGNYTKAEQQYYPIRNDVSSDKEQTEKYRENIQNFYPSESSDSRGAYYLEFAEVENDKVNNALTKDNGKAEILPEYEYTNGRYGYYENVYTDLTKEIVDNIDAANSENAEYQFPGENPVELKEGEGVLIQDNTEEAVKSTIEESNSFTSGEAAAGTEDTTDSSSQDDFSGNSGNDNGSTESDSAFQSDESDSFNGSDSDTFDSDISLEQQSYEEPVESSGADAFSDDFSDQTADSEDSSADVETEVQNQEDTDPFAENQADTDSAEDTGSGTDQTDTQRKILGNIQNQGTAGTQANPYVYLGENIAEYPYYKYELIGDMEYVKNNAETTANNLQSDPNYQVKAGDILLDNEQYWYYKDDNGTLKKYPISVVTGRQPVAFNELQKIPENFEYNYYYRVEKVYFCCKSVDNQAEKPGACVYQGWYYPSYPANEDAYLPVTDGKVATHYISAASYSLTPGKGNYDFVPGGENSCQVEVNSFYYQGGYTNNDWFKKYVFHLSPKASEDAEDGEFENFGIEVDTKSAENATDPVYAEAVTGEDTAAQSVSADDEAVSIDAQDADAENTAGTQQSDASEEVEFTSGYQEADTQDAGETVEAAGDNEDVTVTDENADETSTDVAVDETTEDEADVQAEEDAASDVGDGESTDNITDIIEGYDLVYVNGEPSAEVAEALAAAVTAEKMPCIVNTKKVDLSATSALGGAFKNLIKNATEDTDSHYVNTCVYFFRNIFDDENNAQSLVNKYFYTEFDETVSEGFDEISSYIESENKYRELNENNTGEKTEPLSPELSFARVIEYVINYKYQRLETVKSNLSVLAIEPAKVNEENQIKDSTVLQWLNAGTYEEAKIKNVEVCCEHSESPGSNAYDGNADTFWHSDWSSPQVNKYKKDHNGSFHWFRAYFEKAQTINTFEYQPRKYSGNGSQNGKITKFTLKFYDKNQKQIAEKTDCTFTYSSDADDGTKTIIFDAIKRVASVEVDVLEAYSINYDMNHASCAEMRFYNAGEEVSTTPTITNMTSSEYVGHIDDINSEYDMIYIGDGEGQESGFNKDIVGDNGTLYTHVGGLQKARIQNNNSTWKLMGLYTNDFNSDGSMNTNSSTNSFRGSGNDITNQQYKELMSFVKSGYPVVLGDKLVQDRKVTSKVDNSSYMYKFINEALKYDNVFTRSDLEKGNQKIVFLTMLTKPSIVFSENGKPAEAPRDGHAVGEAIRNEAGKTICSYNYISGEMTYRFTIQDEAVASPASTRYDCRLYFDLNFDGNLSNSEEQAAYMEIRDSSGNVQTHVTDKDGKSHYELKAGEEYTLTRKIPSDYYKLIAWKLEIVNSVNTNIRTSETGYSKQSANGKKVDINVLQILPATTCSEQGKTAGKTKNGTWDLKAELDSKSGKFYEAVKNLEDFNIKVDRVTVAEFSKDRETADSWLNNRQMVIIGFDDVYENIKEPGVEALLQFIKDGKSVIFSHDTTSLYNYNYDGNHNLVNGKELYTPWLINTSKRADWGVQMNTVLREIVGMDRYGITNKNTFTDSTTRVMDLLKQGNDLVDGSNGVSFAQLMQLAGDVAYKSGSAGMESYRQTQGYVNTQIEAYDAGDPNHLVTRATKVNDGAITQYPYVIGSEKTMTIAKTHGQYYQLALEQDKDNDGKNDIVVWYCLSDGVYSNSPNDVRNNYYFYSKGNVIYTGAGHSPVTDDDEVKLFVNAMVAAANVAAVDPEVHFVKSLNPSAEAETSRYYMTDQSSWVSEESSDGGNVLEKDEELYFNVKDYNMVSANLSSGNATNMAVDFYIDSDSENAKVLQDCPEAMKGKKVISLNSVIQELTPYGSKGSVKLGDDGSFHLTENNAYGLNITNIEQYLKKADNSYNENCTVYVRVTSTVNLYGQKISNTSWASIDLKQRQLFEMD